MKAIFKREWKALFQSVTGWLFLAITLGLFGLYLISGTATHTWPIRCQALCLSR